MMDLFQAFLLLVQTHALSREMLAVHNTLANVEAYAPAAGGVVALALHVPEHVLRDPAEGAKPPHVLNLMAAQLVDWQFELSRRPAWFDLRWIAEWDDGADDGGAAHPNFPRVPSDADGPAPGDGFDVF